LQELQTEIEPDRRLRPPTPRELSQFTSEVAIPGLILILETNIRVLKLLQRTIRLAEGKDPTGNRTVPEMRDRAERLSRATLSQLESTLSEVQSAVEGRPNSDDTEQLLSEARTLRDQIQDELERRSHQGDGVDESVTGGSEGHDGQSVDESEFDDTVDIDVESELKSIKDNLEDVEDDSNDKRADDPPGSGTTQSDEEDDTPDDTGHDAPDDSMDSDTGT
jgi:hypothetical protein